MSELAQLEPWLTKKEVAEHFKFSVRTWERKAKGAPSAEIFGRSRFRVSEVEAWLLENDLITRRDDG